MSEITIKLPKEIIEKAKKRGRLERWHHQTVPVFIISILAYCNFN